MGSVNYNPDIIHISVYAGVGGEDAKDFAQMLLRMYRRFAEKRKWKVRYVHDDTTEIRGKGAYDRLREEAGVHRLVRISPFDAKKLRHTSFALVEVLPELHHVKASQVHVPDRDLKVNFFRSSGPGGQNVNKVETAVRVVHIPTGVSASSQVERSQAGNREHAMSLLKAKLVKLMEEKREEDLGKLRVKVTPEWGHEIRSYILHPYKMLRDERLGIKITKVEDVLNGDLDLLITKSKKVQ